MKEQISCRKARREMQSLLDRTVPVSVAESENLSKFMPGVLKTHLGHCQRCRDFFHSLSSFAPELRDQLDEALQGYPAPAPAAALRRETGTRLGVPSQPKRAVGATAAALGRIRHWLFGPTGKPAAVYRWVAVSAITALLVSAIGLRIYSVSMTHRAIEQQIDRVVELIYREPLLPGVESALLRTRPTISDYVEDLDRTVDMWLEETDSQSYLN